MLIDFQVNNYRSFKDNNNFSMEKGKNVRKYKNAVLTFENVQLLKTAVLFGGNANGKTNLINGLVQLRNLVLIPTMNENQLLPVDTFAYNEKDTTFRVKFLKEEIIFDYALIYNKTEIVEECLLADEKVIFKRAKQFFSVLPDQLKILENNIRKNQNLLYFAQTNNVSIAKIAFTWFLEDLILVNTQQVPNILFKSLTEKVFKEKFLKFLRAADFNITDVEVKERQEKSANFQLNFNEGQPLIQENGEITTTVYDVYMTHQAENKSFQIHFNNESTGTKVFIFLGLYILQNKNEGKVLLIDEFDRSFHMELAEALLDMFNHEKQKNQFILTTHELALMDYKLRQDQIWFAEKNEFGETELFSIFDFSDDGLKRSDFSYKKRYLEGRYGAMQIVNTAVLLEALEDSHG